MRISDWSSDVCSSDLCFKRLSCTQADRPFRCLRYVLATAVHRAADAVHDEAAIGIAGMEIADSCRYLHAFPRPGGAFELDRTSVVSGKSVSVRVDLGGRRIIKKKKI